MVFNRPVRVLVALAAASLVLSACDDCGSVSAIPVPDIELLDDAGNSHRDADPWLVIDYGDVDDGGEAVKSLVVRNTGSARLEIENACLVSAANLEEAMLEEAPCILSSETSFLFPSITGETIAGSSEIEVPITFRPITGGPASLFLRVQSNADEEPVVAVQLTGRGTAGRLCADNPILDFGDVYIGDSETLSVTLENCGVRPVDVESWAMLQNPDDAFAVAFEGGDASAVVGRTLAAGESVTLDVTFTPAQVFSYRDTNAGMGQLSTAAPFAADYTLMFLGDGRNAPSCRVNVVPQTVQFGAVAATETQTQQLVIQSVGECGCTVESITDPLPAEAGFSIPSPPSLPAVLKGTRGCEEDPAGADQASNLLIVDVQYTSPDRPTAQVDNATLEVTTSDAAEPSRTVNLEANGGGAPFCQLQVTPWGQGSSIIPPQGRDGVVEFGRVSIHFEKRQPIELTNVGNSSCTITDLEWEVEANTLANEFRLENEDGTPAPVGSLSPIDLQPGETQRYMAVFAPTHVIEAENPFDVFSFGSYSGSNSDSLCGLFSPNTRCNGVRFVTTDTMSTTVTGPGVFSIGFSATPVQPDIDVIPGEVDFGLVTLDCGSPLRRVTVYNTGSGDLEVGQPYATPDTTPATFEVFANAPSFSPSHTITPGGSMAIDVRFYARQLGLVTGELIIPTFEGGEAGPPYSVPMQGEGTLETEQTDVFDQFSDPKTDVLWVVDDSGSMSPFQQQLANNFDQFFTASDVSSADYHIATTTTLTVASTCIPDPINGTVSCEDDPMAGYYTSCGGNDRFITPASSNPDAQFRCNVKVSDSGNVNPSRDSSDSAEGGLQAARRFLEAPNIDDPAINGGFMRDDAKLHVIMVSDEPDQSEGPVDLYVDFFRNLKGFRNDSLVTVSAIAAPSSGCSYTDGGETVSVGGDARYETVVDELNGRFQSICDDDWTTMMSNLGLASLGLKIEFFLSRAADDATLSVCVRSSGAGSPCTPVSQTSDGAADGYFYDSASNSIVFNPGDVPPRGSQVEVNYETFCY
jgi:hypothetical protein